MPWNSKQSSLPDEPASLAYDDGGSGLFDACEARFAATGWQVRCDANHAVWIEDPDTAYSVGIAQWMVGRRPLDKILEYVEVKMRGAEDRARS